MIGKIILDLAPTPKNRRNSEGSFIHLKNGDILFAYSRYADKSWADDANADIYAVVSNDNGDSFSEPFLLYSHKTVKAQNIMAASLYRFKNGDLGLMFLAKFGNGLCLPLLVRSADDGKTWSEPVKCYAEEDYYCVVNDRIIEGENGRLLIPASRHKVTKWHIVDGESRVLETDRGTLSVFGSDDDGRTWQALKEGIGIPLSRGLTSGMAEPGLVSMGGGKLWCYTRTNGGRQYECFSNDNGHNWTEFSPSWFTSPDAPMSVKRLSDGRLLAVWNPVPKYNGRPDKVDGVLTLCRTPFVMAVSDDNGETFKNMKILEDDPKSGYCYTAILETADGCVLLGYSAGGTGDACCLNRQRIRKISLSEI